jgi:hypothetical protein
MVGEKERYLVSSKDILTKKERGRVRYKENKRETKRKTRGRENKRDIKNK